MPIRPENRERYPPYWCRISWLVRAIRARWQCEWCGAAHGLPHPITGSRVVLTVAHLDHTPERCGFANLAALCQRCHLRYDGPLHRANRMGIISDLFARE